MTARKSDDAPRPSAPTEAAKTRAAKGSVQEAIGELIGDDAVEQQGKAEKKAATAQKKTPPRP